MLKQDVWFQLSYDKYPRLFVSDAYDAERIKVALEKELYDVLPDDVTAHVWIGEGS
jgi:hypothetical protein